MKQIISFVFAGIIGGLITLGGFQFLSQPQATPVNNTNFAKTVNVKAGSNPVPFDFKMAAHKSMPVVVHISARESAKAAQNNRNYDDNPFRFFFGDGASPFGGPKQGTGSGVIYSHDGYIITNNHVVEFADEVDVTLYDNRKFRAKVIGTDPKVDLAVIKIEADDLPTLNLADSDKAEIGEWVLAVGNPFDLTSTVTAGIISAKGRSINILGGGQAIESFIQTDAAVNPGNSGGALVDLNGNLLGINTAIATQTGSYAGYSFAIPVNLMSRIIDDIIEYGSFQRAYLGVSISELDNDYATELGVDITQGVVIEELIDGGSAQYAGLLPKDIIIAVAGREIKTVPELQEAIGQTKVGDTITLTVMRGSGTQEIAVRMKKEG